ncbi:MAG TPA: hypothetical protein EYQ64_09375 [Gemmatimonadetes bacterium]|nr:hypothetical protein [Gemmatimonadota bacterium]
MEAQPPSSWLDGPVLNLGRVPWTEIGHVAVHDDPESLAVITTVQKAYENRIWALDQVRQATEELLRVQSRRHD